LKNNRFFLGFLWTLHATLPAMAQTPDHALDKADSKAAFSQNFRQTL
jgi:hypothetical protein